VTAAVNLLERAAALVPSDSSERPRVLLDLGVARAKAGRLAEADTVLGESMALAEAAGDRRLQLRARIEHLFLLVFIDPEGRTSEARADTETIIPELEALGDDLGLCRAWRLVGMTQLMACRYGAMTPPLERSLLHARRAGDKAEEGDALFWLGVSIALGPIPVAEAAARCQTLLEEARELPIGEASLHMSLSLLGAMVGNFAEARQHLERSTTCLRDLGLWHSLGGLSMWEAMVELLAGDTAAAERAVRWGYELLERLGEQSYRSTVAAFLAMTTCDQGRYEEALDFARTSEQLAASDDVYSQVLLRAARGKALGRLGDLEQAEALCREAVALAAESDALYVHGDALMDLAEVVALAGKAEEADAALEEALGLYERKGVTVMAARARERLAELRSPR
jgi:tetratricopeptide (TPR) repeat protein